MDETTSLSKRKIKKLTLGKGVTLEQLLDGWTRCNFLMKHKGRLCNVGRAPNSLFCGNHRPVTETESLPARVVKKAKRDGQNSVVRIPCPIDSSHTIFQHDIEHHVKICNTAARTAEMKAQPYYCENCNSGFNICSQPAKDVDCDELMKKLKRIYDEKVSPFVLEPAETTASIPKDKIMKAVAGVATSFGRIRHAEQNVDIVRQMVAADLLYLDVDGPSDGACGQDGPLTFVELGAGKGMLGLAVKSASEPDAQLVLVERMGCKRKADKVLRDNNLDSCFSRVRMDIRHCLLSALPYVASKLDDGDVTPEGRRAVNKTVIIAKHLCGLATDISLRSLQSFSGKSVSQNNSDQKLSKNAHGVALATCCHHACSWEDYTGASWLRSQGVTSQEFDVLKVWSSWAHTLTKKIRTAEELDTHKKAMSAAVDGDMFGLSTDTSGDIGNLEGENEENRDEEGHTIDEAVASSVPRPSGINLKEMSIIGCMVKRVFDQGRVAYLQELGMRAHQRRYCDRSLSPECYMIIAVHDIDNDAP